MSTTYTEPLARIQLGGGNEESERGVEAMTTALADATLWLHREVLHARWGRKGRDSS